MIGGGSSRFVVLVSMCDGGLAHIWFRALVGPERNGQPEKRCEHASGHDVTEGEKCFQACYQLRLLFLSIDLRGVA